MLPLLTDCTNLNLVAEAEAEEAWSQKPKKKAIFVGVRFHGECRTNPWEARCRSAGRKHNLGYFATAAEAALAYDKFAVQFGRKLNFPECQLALALAADGAPTATRDPAAAFLKRERDLELDISIDGDDDRRLEECDLTPIEGAAGAKKAKSSLQAHELLELRHGRRALHFHFRQLAEAAQREGKRGDAAPGEVPSGSMHAANLLLGLSGAWLD